MATIYDLAPSIKRHLTPSGIISEALPWGRWSAVYVRVDNNDTQTLAIFDTDNQPRWFVSGGVSGRGIVIPASQYAHAEWRVQSGVQPASNGAGADITWSASPGVESPGVANNPNVTLVNPTVTVTGTIDIGNVPNVQIANVPNVSITAGAVQVKGPTGNIGATFSDTAAEINAALAANQVTNLLALMVGQTTLHLRKAFFTLDAGATGFISFQAFFGGFGWLEINSLDATAARFYPLDWDGAQYAGLVNNGGFCLRIQALAGGFTIRGNISASRS